MCHVLRFCSQVREMCIECFKGSFWFRDSLYFQKGVGTERKGFTGDLAVLDVQKAIPVVLNLFGIGITSF